MCTIYILKCLVANIYRFNDRDNQRDSRYDRGNASDNFERKVERYDRRDTRNVDSSRSFDDRRDRTDRPQRDTGRDDRRNDDRFDRLLPYISFVDFDYPTL